MKKKSQTKVGIVMFVKQDYQTTLHHIQDHKINPSQLTCLLWKFNHYALLSLPCHFFHFCLGESRYLPSLRITAALKPLWRTLDPERSSELKPQCALFCPIPLLIVPKEHWQWVSTSEWVISLLCEWNRQQCFHI